jgi:cytoskeletal protein CcmA (bactofilin family)
MMKLGWRTWGQAFLVLTLLGLMVFGLTSSAWAADFRSGETVVIPADEVIDDDLFVTGQRVEVNGTVKGDLFATGGEVFVNGTVEGSLFISGQTLVVNGQVNGSLYAGGYSLGVGPEASIGRSVYFGGFSLTTESGSGIGRSLYTGGYQAIVNGEVANDVSVGSAALELNGAVGGDVTGEVAPAEGGLPPFVLQFPGSVPAVPPGLRVGDEARIEGDVDVVVSEPGRGAGERPQDRALLGLSRAIANRIGDRIGEFIAVLIVGGLLLYFWPGLTQRASSEVQERPLPSAGRGCLITFLFPFAVIVAVIALVVLALLGGLVTFGQLLDDILGIGGATLGLAVALFIFVFSLVTKAIVAYLGGRLILTRLSAQTEPGWWTDFASLVLGALIYEILRAIPILGIIVAVIVTIVGLGAIYVVLREKMRPTPPAAPVPAAEAAA